MIKRKEGFDQSIVGFWKWIELNILNLNSERITDEMIEEIDLRVDELGDFSWELGPGVIKENSLTISPNGSKELLLASQYIISLAPVILDWEFYPAKQAKDWNLQLNMTYEGQDVQIDASLWEFVLLKYKDGNTYEILMRCGLQDKIDSKILDDLVDYVITSTIGEQEKITYIERIEIVDSFDGRYQGKGRKIGDLRRQNW